MEREQLSKVYGAFPISQTEGSTYLVGVLYESALSSQFVWWWTTVTCQVNARDCEKKHLLPWICWASKYPGVIGFLQVFYHCNFSEFYTAKSKWLNSSSAFRTSEEITLDYRKFLEQADIISSGYNKLTWSNLLREIFLQSKHSSKVVQAFNCGDFLKICIIQVVHSFFKKLWQSWASFNNNFQSSSQSVVWRTPGVCGL